MLSTASCNSHHSILLRIHLRSDGTCILVAINPSSQYVCTVKCPRLSIALIEKTRSFEYSNNSKGSGKEQGLIDFIDGQKSEDYRFQFRSSRSIEIKDKKLIVNVFGWQLRPSERFQSHHF